jgi:hypothetical protein
VKPTRYTALLALTTCACSLFASQGPPPPDVKEPRALVSRDTTRMRELHALVRSDLDEIAALQTAFFDVQPARWRQPFPLSQFKYVAMSCLNEPPGDDPTKPATVEGDPTREAIALRYDIRLGCAPPTLPSLWDAVSGDDNDARFAAVQLARVDRIRELRSRLYWRLNQLPGVIQDEQAALATRRAEWRRVRAEVERNRSDYKPEARSEANRRLTAYEGDLLDLADAIVTLDSALPQWPDDLQRRLSSFTLALTTLN